MKAIIDVNEESFDLYYSEKLDMVKLVFGDDADFEIVMHEEELLNLKRLINEYFC